MKKLISIEHLEPGMFVEADVIEDSNNGSEGRFLQVRNAMVPMFTNKRARLTGRLFEKIEKAGGLVLASEKHVDSIKTTGVKMVSIDTVKGKDVPSQVKPITDPNRKPPPAGRLVHFDEEIERAKEARVQATETIREALDDVADGKGMDVAKIESASEIISESILRNVDAMVSLTRIKEHDAYTAVHCMNVCTLVVAMGQAGHIEQSQMPMIVTAALLHDIGKTRIPLEILNKPGSFEPHELAQMRNHAAYSGEILEEAGSFSEEAIAIATQHHEMMDGTGYPLGLKGDQIHPFARMTAVADVYDALTAKRVYKPSMPMYQALLRINKNKGSEFEEEAVKMFIKALGVFPVGSMVELNTKERGIVFEPNPEDSRKPTVGVLTMPNQKDRGAPWIANLSLRSESEGREIVRVLDPDKIHVDIEEVLTDVAERGERSERRMR